MIGPYEKLIYTIWEQNYRNFIIENFKNERKGEF